MNNAPPISRRRLAALVAVTGALAMLTLGIAIASGSVANAASSAAPSAACAVDYTVSPWGKGFQAQIVITNEGAALGSWSLQYSYDAPATLAGGRGAAWSQSGELVTADGGRSDAALESGASTAISATFSAAGKSAVPTDFTLDGAPCTGEAHVSVNSGG